MPEPVEPAATASAVGRRQIAAALGLAADLRALLAAAATLAEDAATDASSTRNLRSGLARVLDRLTDVIRLAEELNEALAAAARDRPA